MRRGLEPSSLDWSLLAGLEDVSKYPALFAALLGTGTWSLDDLGTEFSSCIQNSGKSRSLFCQKPFFAQTLTCRVAMTSMQSRKLSKKPENDKSNV